MSSHDVVAVGGSFGGIEAAQRLIGGLPPDFPAAVLVVIHVASNSPGIMARVLGQGARLPVTTAVDGEPLARGHVYVAPADHHLLVIGDQAHLGRGPRENMSRPAVDSLLRSVALSAGSRAVGVILSGLLDDGASGLRQVKRFGGLTVVQTPSDAVAPDMPLAALCASEVDYRAPAADLAKVVGALVAQPAGPTVPATEDLKLEVEIALGRPVTTTTITKLADPSTLSCPACGGVLSEIKVSMPIRFRCQVGHGYTGEALLATKEASVDEAIRVALRIVEERAALTEKMAAQARRVAHEGSAQGYEERAREYRAHAEILRRAALSERQSA